MRKTLLLTWLCISSSVIAQHVGDIEVVVVTARPDGFQNVDHITQAFTVLSGDELREKVSNSIGETLSGELGVSASDFGQGASRPVIRGLGGARVKMMQDGIGSLDVSTVSVDHQVSIEPGQSEQIEILRGPATLLYGSGAFGGLVNVSTRRIPRKLYDEFSATLDLRFNSVSGGKNVGMKADGSSGSLALHFDGQIRNSDNYDSADGEIENSAVESEDLNFGLSVIGKRSYLGASFGRYSSQYGIPLDPDEPDERTSIDQDQDRFDIGAQIRYPLPGLRSAKVRLGYVDYEHTEFENPGEPGTRFFNNEWEGRIELHHRSFAGWNGAIGMQYRNRRFNSIGDEAFVPRTKLDSWGAFVIEDTDVGNWHFELGARYENQEVEALVFPVIPVVDHDVYSVSAGALYSLGPEYNTGVSLTRAQRAPSIEELLAAGPHLASGTFEEGTTDLDQETSNNLELSLRKTEGRWRWTANIFVNYIEDFIFQQEQDENNDGIADRVDESRLPGGELLLIRYVQDNALFYGIEAESRYEVFDNQKGTLEFRLWGDWVRAELDDGGDLPRISPARIGTSLEYNYQKWHADIDVKHIFQQDRIGTLETSTPDYTMLNIGMGYAYEQGRMNVDLFLRATNILDQLARRHTSFLKERAPLPGRSVMLGLRLGF